MDDEYVRNGVASIFLEVEPLEGKRQVKITHVEHGLIELSVLKRQCLARRIPCIEKMRNEVKVWNDDRNNRQSNVDWLFRTKDARIKLKRLYPKL